MRQNTITYEQSSGDREAIVMSAINEARCARNTIQMGARTSAIELGDCGNPSDPERPVPAAYCVFENDMFPGGGGAAELCIAGTCSACSQPQSSGMTCP